MSEKIKKSKKPQKPSAAEEEALAEHAKHDMIFKCGWCNAELTGYSSLYMHNRRTHPDKVSDAGPKLQCEYCTYTTLSKAGLAIHTNSVHHVDISVKAQKKRAAEERRAAKLAARAEANGGDAPAPPPRKRKSPEAAAGAAESAAKKKPLAVPLASIEGDGEIVAQDDFDAKTKKFAELLSQCSGYPANKVREWQLTLAEHDVCTLQQACLLGEDGVARLPVSELLIKCLLKLVEAKRKKAMKQQLQEKKQKLLAKKEQMAAAAAQQEQADD